MRGRLTLALVFVLLLVALMAPAANLFDHWDTVPGLFGDTEFQVAALALVAGLYAVIALLLTASAVQLQLPVHPGQLAPRGSIPLSITLRFVADTSPPLTQLRI
jgi:hypothetical protein